MNFLHISIILLYTLDSLPIELLLIKIKSEGIKYFFYIIIGRMLFFLYHQIPFRQNILHDWWTMNFFQMHRKWSIVYNNSWWSMRWHVWIEVVHGHWWRWWWFFSILDPDNIFLLNNNSAFLSYGFLDFCFFVNLGHLLRGWDSWFHQHLLLT